ncbi:DNA replication licensing factor, MCM4 component [Spathaspora passalidarum NRRL Y-27907]|uniref:DNA replication licensing factor MCM4 n=1 Tax=Spathaspora passalidarum (strain NRRL Y-27907 / 11-Y1) TaxID=619300 RepID=G3ANB8_SPAPN|nr:DNA replication licensing factor, MCM4 component [Spathaspora passalidarum NRRL Y-27907]EGW32501.1 DNA replication licensing factor, MCM4 component [Spathaspora passalidarum NRRL Y-27907]
MSSSPPRQSSAPSGVPATGATGNTPSESISQSQQPIVPSSPLFFASSNPPSDAQPHPSSQVRYSQVHDISSPLHYTSSVHGSDIGSSQHVARTRLRSDIVDVSSPRLFSGTSSDQVDPEEPVRVIWGTNVSIQECSNVFRDFLLNFKMRYRKLLDERDVEPEDSELYYVQQLNEIRRAGVTNMNLDARNLLSFNNNTKKLYYQLINYPQEIIPIMDHTLKDSLLQLANDANEDLDEIEGKVYTIRPYNVNLVPRGIRELNPNDIDKLVSIKGLTIRSTSIIPDMKIAFFKCNACGHTLGVEIDRGVISEPTKCPREICGQTNSMVLIHNRSSFADKQVIKLQETPDLVPDGQTPHSINLCVYDDLVDGCRAGDRIEVCGIFRSIPVRVNSRQRALKSLYKTYLDVVHIKKVDTKRLGADISTLQHEIEQQEEVEQVRQISAHEVEQIKEISQRDDLYEVLARSLAPSIYEMDDVKKGILLQLFGGTNKTFKKGGRYRGDINILLCGDPSTSKSQLLQYVHKIAPRGVYTSGKGSSAVGLTAYITRDVDTKQLVLESGALVLSDGGVCCIDEFDKMSDSTRSVLHEVMEQQTISIAKAGIITTLNARTSILASANPINSRYDPNLPVTGNIDLPPPLLSRFDLIYLILDKVDEGIDRQLAKHLTSMYLEDRPETVNEGYVLPIELLSGYIQYAKENYNPTLTVEAKSELVRSYVEMRKQGEDVRTNEKRITATTRQLESMIRLSEAHAKMRLSHHVELIDVKESVRLIKSAIKEYATDPITGRIDMDMVQTGTTFAQRRIQQDLMNEILHIVEDHNNLIRFSELILKLNEQSSTRIENQEVVDAVKRLVQGGKVIETGDGHRRTIRKIAIV